MNTQQEKRSDAHVHFGDFSRLPQLLIYVESLQLDAIGLMSLPTAGTGEYGDAIVNFNPEVLAASSVLAARGTIAPAFGSLDNRCRLCSPAEGGERWNPARQIQEMREAGFQGVKLWEGKPELQRRLSLFLDDPLLCKAYREAGSANMPVLIHIADPPIFWTQEEVLCSYVNRNVPDFEELMRQAGAICKCAPNTHFIFPHLLFLAGSLDRLAGFLNQYENASVDLAPGLYMYPALGAANGSGKPLSEQQYAAAREFFSNYNTRILFGTDSLFLGPEFELLPPHSLEDNCDCYETLLRFLTHTTVSNNPFSPLPDVRNIVGLGLGAETIRLIIYGNMKKLFQEPIILDPTSIEKYLNRWAPPLAGEADDSIRARQQRVDKGLKLIFG
ncbi:MAG: amidohydrolase [Spirochaetales bacterium]|nr:amidohydrolase [Spirochaetales bacterium]